MTNRTVLESLYISQTAWVCSFVCNSSSTHFQSQNMGSRRTWGSTKSKVRRPLGTVALPPGVMESILADVKEFIGIEDWYVQAGIPHHRGYLLYGPPGTGKSA
jgi:chaperone BCS1